MRILFLDIDGVLMLPHSIHFAPYAIDNLRTILSLHTDLSIVLSSSWRISNRWKQDLVEASTGDLVKEFDLAWIDKIIDITPDLFPQTRDEEILTWLEDHPGVSGYVILDDLKLKNPNLIHCKSRSGLDSKVFTQILHRLTYIT